MQPKDYIEAAVAFVLVLVGGFGMGWYKILKETNALLVEQNKELKADNKEWRDKHVENMSAIANLQGQLDILKDIPLQNIASTLDAISLTNDAILRTLKASATTLVTDNKAQAKAVRAVKADLKHNKE